MLFIPVFFALVCYVRCVFHSVCHFVIRHSQVRRMVCEWYTHLLLATCNKFVFVIFFFISDCLFYSCRHTYILIMLDVPHSSYSDVLKKIASKFSFGLNYWLEQRMRNVVYLRIIKYSIHIMDEQKIWVSNDSAADFRLMFMFASLFCPFFSALISTLCLYLEQNWLVLDILFRWLIWLWFSIVNC